MVGLQHDRGPQLGHWDGTRGRVDANLGEIGAGALEQQTLYDMITSEEEAPLASEVHALLYAAEMEPLALPPMPPAFGWCTR